MSCVPGRIVVHRGDSRLVADRNALRFGRPTYPNAWPALWDGSWTVTMTVKAQDTGATLLTANGVTTETGAAVDIDLTSAQTTGLVVGTYDIHVVATRGQSRAPLAEGVLEIKA